MTPKRQRYIFNIVGSSIIISWVVMIGLLIRKNSMNEFVQSNDITTGKISNIKTHQRDWMEIYLEDKKIGYSVSQVSPLGEDYLMQEEIFLRLNLMGHSSGVQTVTRSVVGNDFFLKSFRFRMTSGVVTFQVSGKVEGDRMFLEIGEGTAKRSESIHLAAPPMMGAGVTQFFRGRPVKLGEAFKFPFFDPSTMVQKEMHIKVLARERLVIDRIEYPTFRLEGEMWGQRMAFWLDEDGIVLKEQGLLGLTLVKSNAAKAPRDMEGPGGKDFYELAAIKVKRNLRNADRLTYLKLKVEGLHETHFDTGILNQGRQKFHDGVIEITREKTPIKAAYVVPYTGQSEKMRPFMNPEFNIESDDRAIMEKAREIAGDSKGPVTVAGRLMAWVYGNIEKRPVVSVPSALEVLKTRVGDCNEHAVLLTALLRSSGIPARVCAGLVYARGKFFYHAWTEGYMGSWISMDATLNQMPVDATHVKLVQGGPERQVEIIGLIGKLGLEVMGVEHD